MENKKELTSEEAGRIGGNITKEKYGLKHYQKLGANTGEINKKKGSEYFKRIRQIGIAKQKAKKEAEEALDK